MNLKKLAIAAAVTVTAAAPALAELVVPSLTYRTGPYAANGIPWADGFSDYMTLINERDGGVGGEKIRIIECETAYNTEKGVECYEAIKGEGALVFHPRSTGITYQLIPKITADNIPIHTPGLGRTSAKNGEVFNWVFNYPTNYWDGASGAITHLLNLNDNDIKGKKVTLLYHNSAYGKEPIRTLELLAKKHGFALSTLAVDHPGQEQKSQWLQIRRDRPDYVLMWGWGIMNQVAIQEAANIRYPMENFIGVWWSGSENDVMPAAEKANGYKSLAFFAVNDDFPIYNDIKKFVVDAGKAAGAGNMVGDRLYNAGIMEAMLTVEAIKNAQKIHGTMKINASMMRDGMEALKVDNALMKSLGMENFLPEFEVSCQNHGGNGIVNMSQWDAAAGKWSIIDANIQSDQDIIQPLVDQDSMAFAKESGVTPSCVN